MDDTTTNLFRVLIKPRNASPNAERTFFVEAESENEAVVKILAEGAPEVFGSIHVDRLENATFVL